MTRSSGRTLRMIRGGRLPAWLAIALATALILGGCGGGQPQGEESEPASAAASAAPPASPEVGTWETALVTRAQFLKTLEESGFEKYARQFKGMEDWFPKEEAVLSLELRDGSWTLYGALDGQAPSVFDRQTYEVVDEHFELTSGVGGSVLQPRIEDEALTLEFVSSTEPAYEEVPVEAILRVYYTTAPFHRTAS